MTRTIPKTPAAPAVRPLAKTTMAYEYKEGKGTAFPNDYKTLDTHPDFRGKFMWQGELLEISIWEGETQAGVKRLSLVIQEPRQKSDALQRVVTSGPKPAAAAKKFTPQDDSDIPF